ncbi:MAG: glucosamine-6-phosphate deaminase [Clostridiaceae bacterium]|jgi:glucosamine-6-phosphate deaminase|nr:glucosamine-6-phosphate deaminase [Clostridiaceae bacterium]
MKLICVSDEHEIGLETARLIASVVRLKPEAVLGLATGSSPIGAYAELARMCAEENLDFSDVRTVNLDEYVGLDGSHPQSYRYFMHKYLFDKVNIDPKNTYVPDGFAEDPDEECDLYDELLESLGYADLQLLGIGVNGHIGFNEPADFFIPETHVVKIAESTIDANQRFFDTRDEVPRYAITIGIKGILCAERIVLIASGRKKAEALKAACFGPVTPKMPASILQVHPNVTVIADDEAFSLVPFFGHDEEAY